MITSTPGRSKSTSSTKSTRSFSPRFAFSTATQVWVKYFSQIAAQASRRPKQLSFQDRRQAIQVQAHQNPKAGFYGPLQLRYRNYEVDLQLEIEEPFVQFVPANKIDLSSNRLAFSILEKLDQIFVDELLNVTLDLQSLNQYLINQGFQSKISSYKSSTSKSIISSKVKFLY